MREPTTPSKHEAGTPTGAGTGIKGSMQHGADKESDSNTCTDPAHAHSPCQYRSFVEPGETTGVDSDQGGILPDSVGNIRFCGQYRTYLLATYLRIHEL